MVEKKIANPQVNDSASSYLGFSLKERRIYMWGFVDADNSLHFVDGFDQMRGQDPIIIDITSGGGEIRAALDIYNRIRNSGGPVIVVTFGGVASAAMLIFLAADERLAAADCLIRFHWPVTYSSGNFEDTPDTYEDKHYFSRKMFILINKIISDRTSISPKLVAHYGRHMTAFTGEEAKQAGIVTEVFDGKRSFERVAKRIDVEAKKIKKGLK